MIKNNIIALFLIIILPVMTSGAATVYVSTDGDNANSGTAGSPVRTIEFAMKQATEGDTIFINPGRWHENIVYAGLNGTAESPIVVMPRAGGEVILDGSLPIESAWTLHDGYIYKTTLDQDIWQLFVEDWMMMPARWPNAFLKDRTVWDRERYWGHGNEGPAENGTFVDSPHGDVNLATSGIDATGAIAIMNIGSWKTWGRTVTSHAAGSSTFSYSPVSAYKDKHHYYYLEGKLELLDAPGEWYYDTGSKELYLWMPDSTAPSGNIRGKVQSYVFNIEKSSHIKIVDIDFFATTFYFKNCTNISVEDCDLQFPSCSKRMLGINAQPDVTVMYNANTYNPTNNSMINCGIRYTESQAFSFKGNSNRVENCRFYGIDWVVADRPGLMNSMYNDGESNIFRRNSANLCGASSTLYPGDFPIVELNRISETGFMQSDGSITQLVINAQPGSQIRYNWYHNTIKSGARFDAPIPPVRWGHGGTMRHNVIWQTNIGLMPKGERHFIYHNSVVNCSQNGIVVFNDSGDGGGGNVGTFTRNNFSDKLSGDRSTYTPVPGEADHNWNGYQAETNFREQVYDYANLDFRPRGNSELVDAGILIDGVNDRYIGAAPDIGAYEFGDSIYWIAGRQLKNTSTPIPLNKGRTNYEFVDLMWLEGYKSVASDVYFGMTEGAVQAAGQGSPEYMGMQSGNVFNPGSLEANKTYYWRIDAVGEDSTLKGDVWHFTAGVDANPELFQSSFKIFGRINDSIFPLENVTVKVDNRKALTDSAGEVIMKALEGGRHQISFKRKGYISISDSVEILSDTSFTDTLHYTTFDVNFLLLDKASERIIPGATVEFNRQIMISDSTGMVHYNNVEYAIYEVSAVAPGFFPLEIQGMEIWSDTTIILSLDEEYLEVSVSVLDYTTGGPVYRAEIKYNNDVQLTNGVGEVVLENIPPGNWIFRIEHSQYFAISDSMTISKDTSVVFRMNSITASLKFFVEDAGGPVANQAVFLNGNRSLTNTKGEALFYNILARKKYGYSIERDGFKPVVDSIYLEWDTSLQVMLEPVTGLGEINSTGVKVYPNPLREHLFIETPDDAMEIYILDMQGRLLVRDHLSKGINAINLNWQMPGIYILEIRKDALISHRQKIIIKPW